MSVIMFIAEHINIILKCSNIVMTFRNKTSVVVSLLFISRGKPFKFYDVIIVKFVKRPNKMLPPWSKVHRDVAIFEQTPKSTVTHGFS